MEASRPTQHVAQDELRRFLDEALDEAREVSIEAHLEDCEECRAALERVAGEPSDWESVRAHLSTSDVRAPGTVAGSSEGQELDELAALLDPTDDPTSVGRIGCYEIRGLIGRGTAGIVLKAFEPRLDRFVALKLLSPTYRGHGPARQRFEREGRAIAAVAHPHVVPVFAVDEHRGLPYIVMRYVPGESLEERIAREGTLSTAAVARIGVQVARALAAAHDQGIVHRDVKPANVLLEGGVERALVTDFGLASVADEASITRSGVISGTPHYMSPEQARGEVTDARSDLFSLGSLLYAACTGRPPFRAENLYGVIQRVTTQNARPIREVRADVEPWLAAFVERCMERTPGDRFASAAEAADALEAELAHAQNPLTVPVPPRDWMRSEAVAAGGGRRPWILVGAIFVAAASVAGWSLRDGAGKSAPRGEIGASVLGAPVAGLVGTSQTTREDDDAQALPEGWAPETLEGDDGPVTVLRHVARWAVDAEGAAAFVGTFEDGDIEVVAGESERIELRCERTVRRGAAPEAAGWSLGDAVRLVREGENVRLTASPAAESRPEGAGVVFVLEVPAHVETQLTTRSGDVHVEGLRADLELRAQEGDVVVAGTRGHVSVTAVRGDVVAFGLEGDAELFTSGGDIALGLSAGHVYAQAAGGDIDVDGVHGATMVHAEGGDVDVRLATSPGAEAYFSSAGGDVSLEVGDGVDVRVTGEGVVDGGLAPTLEPDEDGYARAAWTFGEDGSEVRLVASSGELCVERVDAPFAGVTPRARGGLGGSELRGGGLGGSGLGGSGLGGSAPEARSLGGSTPEARSLGGSGAFSRGAGRSGAFARAERFGAASSQGAARRARLEGAPRPGALATVVLDTPRANIDAYSLYLPVSHDAASGPYPVLVYLQGGLGVGGDPRHSTDWGLLRLVRDETELDSERNRLLLDHFVIAAPHIDGGRYDQDPEAFAAWLDEVVADVGGDPGRVALTGLSSGGHGTWGLGRALPGRFSALAPIAGHPGAVDGDVEPFRDVRLWVAHNPRDSVVEVGPVDALVRSLERHTGDSFLRVDARDVETGVDPGARRVRSFSAAGNHDAWTDVYTSAAFYRWLAAGGAEAAEPDGLSQSCTR